MPVFDVVAMLIACSIISRSTGRKMHTHVMWNKYKLYINSAHRILQLIEIKVKLLYSHDTIPLNPHFFTSQTAHAPWIYMAQCLLTHFNNVLDLSFLTSW
jgi:hypothetical protein